MKSHLEAIVELKNIINIDFIKRMIPFIEHKCSHDLKVRNTVIPNIRNGKGYNLNYVGSPTDVFYWNYVKLEIQRLYPYYTTKFPKLVSNKLNQIQLLKYNVGGKYNVHVDQFTTSPRHLSIIINLNDDYEGGDLVFTDQKEKEIKRFKLDKGSIIFFPSNFMYPHIIEPITKGKRYSIVSWLQ
jgi:Rps23 Pro-64 3,4-dihydroxylase Tpa1-like proline 4-hydroxylase